VEGHLRCVRAPEERRDQKPIVYQEVYRYRSRLIIIALQELLASVLHFDPQQPDGTTWIHPDLDGI
jgi:hypothetical protein